jgi:hypothetical protein
MAQPTLNPFSKATACEACPAGQLGSAVDDDITSCTTRFTPADSAALKAAVGTCTRTYDSGSYVYSCTGGCLGETPDGSCPIFAASNGVIGDWDVSAVTSMYQRKCILPLPLCGHAFRRRCVF